MKISPLMTLPSILCLLLTTSGFADGFITTDIYSLKSKSGTPIFTDKKPEKTLNYITQTIEAADSTDSSRQQKYNYRIPAVQYSNTQHKQTRKIIVEHRLAKRKKSKKKKSTVSTCKYYKTRFSYFSNKMKKGYKSSQYEYLERNRKKYKKLLFNRCETKTFSD